VRSRATEHRTLNAAVRRAGAFGGLACYILISGCGSGPRHASAAVLIQEGDTVQKRLRVAAEFVTEPRRAWLVHEARLRYPWLSEDQLSTLLLSYSGAWNPPNPADDRVWVVVTLRDGPANGKVVVKYCRDLVAKALEHEREVRARGPGSVGHRP
jgi:hypothetical protein